MTKYAVSGLAEMRKYFREDIPQQIDDSVAELRTIHAAWTEQVRANAPVGPSHRPGIPEGNLAASVSGDFSRTGDTVRMRVEVGGENVDYLNYVAAREGDDWPWYGATAAEDLMNRALGGSVRLVSAIEPGG